MSIQLIRGMRFLRRRILGGPTSPSSATDCENALVPFKAFQDLGRSVKTQLVASELD